MPLLQIVGLVLAAVAGGAINAVAGGGTLVTFPTLLFYGVPPIIANATSTLALVIGTSGGIYGFREHLGPVRPWLRRFVPVSLLGGLLGAILLNLTSNRTFGRLVPFLILFASILFLAQGFFRRMIRAEGEVVVRKRSAIWGIILFQFGVAVYGGYFGAGIGILMLASLGFIGLQNIHEMNTLKTSLGSLINSVAAIWFIFAGLIDWRRAVIMTGGAVVGYYLGSKLSQRIPQRRVRQIITAIGFILSAVTFCQEFGK